MWFDSKRNGSYLLLLGSDQFQRERSIVGALRGFDGPVFTMSSAAPRNRNRLFDEVLQGDPLDGDSALAAVRDFEAKTGARPVAVIPVNDWTLRAGLAISEAYGLPFLSRETVAAARDKSLMKAAFAKAGIPVARSKRFSNLEGLEDAAAQLGYPLVIKPVEFGGSGGVMKVESPVDLERCFLECKAVVDAHGGAYGVDGANYLAEEYVVSLAEVSVEVVTQGTFQKVLTVTEKFLGPEPYFAEVAHLVPSASVDDAGIRELALSACAALGIDKGVAHVEIKICRGGRLVVMEVGARTAGDGILDQVERVYGVNPYSLHVASYLGRLPAEFEMPPPKGVSCLAFLHPEPGMIEEVTQTGIDTVDVVSLYVSGQVGKRAQVPQNWSTREGIVEFFWPDLVWQEKHDGPVRRARDIAESIFKTRG